MGTSQQAGTVDIASLLENNELGHSKTQLVKCVLPNTWVHLGKYVAFIDFHAKRWAIMIVEEYADQLFGVHPEPPDQPPVGRRPTRYLQELPAGAVLANGIFDPEITLQRNTVRKICLNKAVPVLTAYAVAMAWGGQRLDHFRTSSQADALPNLLDELRESTWDRAQDFERVKDVCVNIPGLGISFYTKLLFFFRPEPDAYILDQWTGKSAHLLFEDSPVQLTAALLPSPKTTGAQYADFCDDLEQLGEHQGRNWTGEEVERAVFDRPRGEWRHLVKEEFN